MRTRPSESFNYGKNQDVCTTNAEGVGNGNMVSTFSYPESDHRNTDDRRVALCRPDC